MIMDVDVNELKPGDHVVITTKVTNVFHNPQAKGAEYLISLSNGKQVRCSESTTFTISTHEMKP